MFKVNNKNLRRTSSFLTLNKFLFVIISAKTSENLQKVCVSSSEKIEKEDYHYRMTIVSKIPKTITYKLTSTYINKCIRRNLLKVSNKDTRTTSFFYLSCQLWTYFKDCSVVSMELKFTCLSNCHFYHHNQQTYILNLLVTSENLAACLT